MVIGVQMNRHWKTIQHALKHYIELFDFFPIHRIYLLFLGYHASEINIGVLRHSEKKVCKPLHIKSIKCISVGNHIHFHLDCESGSDAIVCES